MLTVSAEYYIVLSITISMQQFLYFIVKFTISSKNYFTSITLIRIKISHNTEAAVQRCS